MKNNPFYISPMILMDHFQMWSSEPNGPKLSDANFVAMQT